MKPRKCCIAIEVEVEGQGYYTTLPRVSNFLGSEGVVTNRLRKYADIISNYSYCHYVIVHYILGYYLVSDLVTN